MKVVAVIMAGGRGERFWPKSRANMPKQFLSLTSDGKTMIQHTVERISKLINLDDIFVVTAKGYKELVKEQLSEIPTENILLEPVAKNTAPCIGLAAAYVKNKYEDAIMVVLPSDHLIKHNELFLDTLKDAIRISKEQKNMVTIGIMPSYPETGYGYIHFGARKESAQGNIYEVINFVEKPKLELAKEYLASGKYLWNSGMFVWKTSTILNQFKEFLPEMYESITLIEKALQVNDLEKVEEQFRMLNAESIDYGIMEKAKDIYTIPGNFGWDDVGNWLSLERINKTDENNNVVKGNVITIDSRNMIVEGRDKLLATVGVENIIVVDTEDALLICSKDSTQDVKKVIENLKICNRREYL